MTIQKLKQIFESDQEQKKNTYIVPKSGNTLKLVRDELCYVRYVDDKSFKFFRAMDGKVYHLNEDKLDQFKLVGR